MTHRLFFALWLKLEAISQIKNLFRHYNWPVHAKLIPEADWHVTLSFLGSATEQQYQELLPLMSQIMASSFELTFDRLVYWSKPDMLLLEATSLPQALLELVHDLNSILKREHWKIDTRTFKPHITLARNFPDPISQPRLHLGELQHPITLEVNEFCLADSAMRMQRQAEHYHILHKWKLQQF